MQDALGAATSTDEASFSTAKARSPSVHDRCKAAYGRRLPRMTAGG
jgi:hypothetical protein